MWTSREGWLSALGQWARSPSFAACAAAARVSMAPVTLLAVAAVMAEHADHATGRHVAVTRATIAEKVGCSPDTVTAAWRLLRVARWVVEAQRGHGSPGTPAAGRRPSVYHLVPRQQPPTPQVQEAPTNSVRTKKSGDNPDLPPKAGIGLLTPVGSNSPSAHARPKKSPITDPAAVRRYRAAPRPLPVQRLAAELVARTHGLHRGHIGAVCDAITTAGIDPATWTARAITHALDTDMKTRGWTWPDRIDHPGAFLASRFKRLDWQPEDGPPSTKAAAVPPPARTRAEREAVTLPVYVPQAPMVLTDAQQARITTARAAIREILDRRVRPESALALTRHTRTANRHNQRPPHV
ncbi:MULTISPECIES: hypothetical protein [Mycobacteriaceae]|nr:MULTISPECIES: hypothetical protein [Mycobacteriaceae]UGT84231.1 rep protein [Mycobacterium kansasii]UGT89560.1 rep protein [Mycobacterium kansasii]